MSGCAARPPQGCPRSLQPSLPGRSAPAVALARRGGIGGDGQSHDYRRCARAGRCRPHFPGTPARLAPPSNREFSASRKLGVCSGCWDGWAVVPGGRLWSEPLPVEGERGLWPFSPLSLTAGRPERARVPRLWVDLPRSGRAEGGHRSPSGLLKISQSEWEEGAVPRSHLPVCVLSERLNN